MHNLFRFTQEYNVGSVELRQWSYAKTGLLNNLKKVQDFYQTYPIAVEASHVLVRLIQSIAISRNLTFDRYVANCNRVGLVAAKAVGFTTSISKGKLWDGVFYGRNYKEIVIAHDSLFSLNEVYQNWQQQSAVTVLQSEETELGLQVPDGRVNTSSEGLSIIAVNVSLLMAQYYCFNKEQDLVEQSGGARKTIYQFVHAYALTGMLPSHLDCVCFNRLYSRLLGAPNAEPIKKHSFFLTDYSSSLDSVADQQLKYVRRLDKRFGGVMRTVALPVSGSLDQFSILPSEVACTVQVYWALTLSRLKILSFLCLIRENPEVVNGGELETVRWLMRINQTKQIIRNNLGMETYYTVSKYLDIPGIE